MPNMPKHKAMSHLRKAQLDLIGLGPTPTRSLEFDKTYRDVKVAISNVFGEESDQIGDFYSISFSAPPTWTLTSPESQTEINRRNQESFETGIKKLKSLIDSMMDEIDNYWPDDNKLQTPQITMKIFISHSSKDSALATLLTNLLQKALNLSSDDIRCTSVIGYGLPGGVSTNDTLRSEVFGAELVIGLITPNSLGSAYVAFELGARWGVNKPMLPLLAAGASHADLEGPLEAINALESYTNAQVTGLVEQIGKDLDIKLERVSSFTEEINQMVSLSSTTKENDHNQSRQITDSEAKISVINLWSDIASNINYLTDSNSHLLEPKRIKTLKSRIRKLRELGIIENELGGLLADMHGLRNAITHGEDAFVHPENLSQFINAAERLESIVSHQEQEDQHES